MSYNTNKITKKFISIMKGTYKILAIIVVIYGAYEIFYKDKNPNLQVIVESITPVLDINENIDKLDILYNNQSIRSINKNLSVIRLKVINNSNVNIKQSDYDKNYPFKIVLINSTLLETPKIVFPKTGYIYDELKIDIDSLNKSLTLSNLLLDGKDYYNLSLLLLHSSDTTPSIKAVGKISGQGDGINTIPYITNENKSLAIPHTLFYMVIVFIILQSFMLYFYKYIYPTLLNLKK